MKLYLLGDEIIVEKIMTRSDLEQSLTVLLQPFVLTPRNGQPYNDMDREKYRQRERERPLLISTSLFIYDKSALESSLINSSQSST